MKMYIEFRFVMAIHIEVNFLLLLYCYLCVGQQTHVVLDQGSIVGLKIFPESSRTAVYAFLGVPYAEPPVGELRFALPRPHNGWNWTLQTVRMRPHCPQLTNTIYDETPDETFTLTSTPEMDEDCLYLNIWVSEDGMRYGNRPVVVIITGEEMSIDWARNRPTGLDFALEGVIVITVQYRTNIFGWINLQDNLAGNYGLHDQQLAMHWIQQNIQKFGGNPNQVTLLGHGTTGYVCALIHMIDPNCKTLFSKIILMSGNYEFVSPPSKVPTTPTKSSQLLIEKLGCHFEKGNQIVKCLRSKSVSDLLKAFESLYNHGNATALVGPVLDVNIEDEVASGNFSSNRPLIIGIGSNEGAFLNDYWIDLARDNYTSLWAYINNTEIPRVLLRHQPPNQVSDTLSWKYFEANMQLNETSHLLNAMQRMRSEALYESPFYRTIESLAAKTPPSFETYAYVLHVSNSMDMRGKVNLFGGTSHSSDLPFLLGPTLFQQIARRRFNPTEQRICRQIKTSFANFIKFGRPTLERVYSTWLSYNSQRKFIQILGEAPERTLTGPTEPLSAFERNLPEIEQMLGKEKFENNYNAGELLRKNRHDYKNSPTGRSSKSASFVSNQQDYSYFFHLKDVYAFWNVLLPNMIAHTNNDTSSANTINEVLAHRVRLIEASADAARYKRGFFLLLVLFSLLLALLAICVYLLRHDRNDSKSLFSL